MDVHQQIAREFEQVFAQDGFKRAQDRSRLLETFLRREDHVSVEELTNDLAAAGGPTDVAFVAQALEQFVHYGLATPIRGEDGQTRYEHLHIGRHHDHIICVSCGRIVEVACPLQDRVADLSRSTGFQAVHTHLQIHGICPACVAARPARFSLDQVAAGEKVRVVEIGGGRAMRQRLTSMGLSIGSVVRRQNTNRFGPVIVSVGTTRLAIGRGMAERVIVEEPESTRTPPDRRGEGE